MRWWPPSARPFLRCFQHRRPYAGIVARILADNPDGTRFTLIPQMLAAMAAAGLARPGEAAADGLVAAYGQKVLAAVMAAPEMPGATRLACTQTRRLLPCLHLLQHAP